MAAPIVSLVLARLRRRGATALISMAAVGAAAALIAIVTGIGLVAADATVARTLAGEGVDRPLVRISRFAPTATDYDAIMSRTDAGIQEHLGGLTTPPVRGVLTRELLDLDQPLFELVVAVDQPDPLVSVVQGGCPDRAADGSACEAMLLSETEPDFDFTSARPAPNLHLTIVGRGIIDPAVPFGDLDQRGPFGRATIGGGDYQTGRRSPAVLLVNGVDGCLAHAGLGRDRTDVRLDGTCRRRRDPPMDGRVVSRCGRGHDPRPPRRRPAYTASKVPLTQIAARARAGGRLVRAPAPHRLARGRHPARLRRLPGARRAR
jgi:hypothetical protein